MTGNRAAVRDPRDDEIDRLLAEELTTELARYNALLCSNLRRHSINRHMRTICEMSVNRLKLLYKASTAITLRVSIKSDEG